MADANLPAIYCPPDVADYIHRYADGQSVQAIAQECGVARSTIYNRIAKFTHSGKFDKDYRDLVTEALIARMALADERLANAKTKEDIACAREECRFARMDLERRRPELYGHKQPDQDSKIIVIVNRKGDDNGNNTQTIDVSPCNESEGHKI